MPEKDIKHLNDVINSLTKYEYSSKTAKKLADLIKVYAVYLLKTGGV